MSATVVDDIPLPQRSYWKAIVRFCRKQPLGTFGLVLVVVMAIVGFTAELIAPYNPTANDFAAMTEPPSWAHLLGTDQFGRDLMLFTARAPRSSSV